MGTGEHYPMFGALERASLLSTEELCLPMHPSPADEEVDRVLASIARWEEGR